MTGIFAAVATATYPYADALKLKDIGSDADDALILAGRSLLNFENPYVHTTYLGNSISPGPGWALLAIPFGASGLYALFFPTTMALALWALRSLRLDWLTLSRFVLLLASSLFVWELALVGNDYLAFAMLTLTAAMLLQKRVLSTVKLGGLIVLVGLLSTCRIVFVFLPLLIGFSLVASFPHRAIAVMVAGVAICLTSTGVFLLSQTSYPPLNLLAEKAQASFSSEGLILAITVCLAAAIVMLVNWRTWRPITHLAIGFAVPWITVAIADLLRLGSLSNWGGASFLAFPLPFVVLATITNSQDRWNQVNKTTWREDVGLNRPECE
jgi:hypothetical protein